MSQQTRIDGMAAKPAQLPYAICEMCWLDEHARWEPESIGRTLSSIPALMAESSALYGLSEGEFPSQLPPQGTAGQAYTQFQRSLGLKPEMRPATQLQRAVGTFTGAVADPLNLFGGAGLARQGLSNVARGLGLFEKGVGVQSGIEKM